MRIHEQYDLSRPNFTDTLKVCDAAYSRKVGLFFAKYANDTPNKVLTQVMNIGCGVELELENRIRNFTVDSHYWAAVADGSLRNSGLEYVSNLGLRIKDMWPAIKNLCESAKAAGCMHSDRTSVHVHINVANLTFEQLNSFIVLYTLFEEAMFKFASHERMSNVFCVPLSYCMTGNYTNLQDLIQHAEKYTAFNLRAVREKGTVEFRHMLGTWDYEKIFLWLFLIGLLKRHAAHVSFDSVKEEVARLKYRSDYSRVLSNVFYGFSELLPWTPEQLDQAVSDAKIYFYGD